MRLALHNYERKPNLRVLAPLLPAVLLPIALMGVTVRPVLDFSGLTGRLEEAKSLARGARDAHAFMMDFGPDGPPTEKLQQIEASLVERLPRAFTPTDFYRIALDSTSGLEVQLETIVPGSESDLEFAVAGLSIHERVTTLKGRARPSALPIFLSALHRRGYPVTVHGCKLHALAEHAELFDFHLELGVLFLSSPAVSELDEVSEP